MRQTTPTTCGIPTWRSPLWLPCAHETAVNRLDILRHLVCCNGARRGTLDAPKPRRSGPQTPRRAVGMPGLAARTTDDLVSALRTSRCGTSTSPPHANVGSRHAGNRRPSTLRSTPTSCLRIGWLDLLQSSWSTCSSKALAVANTHFINDRTSTATMITDEARRDITNAWCLCDARLDQPLQPTLAPDDLATATASRAAIARTNTTAADVGRLGKLHTVKPIPGCCPSACGHSRQPQHRDAGDIVGCGITRRPVCPHQARRSAAPQQSGCVIPCHPKSKVDACRTSWTTFGVVPASCAAALHGAEDPVLEYDEDGNPHVLGVQHTRLYGAA